MKNSYVRHCAAALVGALALALAGCASEDLTQAGSEDNGLTAAVPPEAGAPAIAYNFYEPKSEAGLKADTNYGFLIAKAGPGFDPTAFMKLGMKVMSSFSVNGGTYYRLHKKNDVLETLNRTKAMPGLLFVEPEPKTYLCEDLAPGAYGTPGDPRVNSELWPVHTTKAVDAWKTYGFGPNKAYVANVDTGVRFGHEDMADRVVHAYSWYLPDGMNPLSYADIGNGYSYEPWDDPDPVDYNTIQGANSTDGHGHGTITCGIMSAAGNNDKGTAGVCWGPDLISYKGINDAGIADIWGVFGSIWHLAKWKRENGHTSTIPMNFSMTQRSASHFAIDMIEYGLQNGIMVVAASGNEGQRLHVFPAAYTGVMAVGATTGADTRWSGSNYGRHLSVMAPGLNVVAPYAAGDSSYANVTGTSMAAPHVTGLIGYMLTFNPDLKPDQIKSYIERNTDYIGGATGFTEECGWGRINVLKTIQAVKGDRDANRTPPSDYTTGAKVKMCVATDDGGLAPFRLPVYGTGVYLYRCDEDGKIANYVASAIAGDTWTEWTPETGFPLGDVAYFPMLRPSFYIAKTYQSAWDYSVWDNASETASTEVFRIGPSEDIKEVPLVLKRMKVIYIQTLPTSDPVRGGTADTKIDLLMDDGYGMPFSMVGSGDDRYYDILNYWPMPTAPGTYYIRVTGPGYYYDYETGESYFVDPRGEYALHVTNNILNWQPSPAPGTYTAAKGGPFEGSKSQSFGPTSSQLIEFDKVYYGSLEDHNWQGDWGSPYGGDWYRFEVK